LLIYLDNCCYNRPFDEQTQVGVRLETIAKLTVQLMMACGKVAFVWSKILDYELSFNPYEKRRTTIGAWRARAATYVETTEELLNSAEVFERQGIKPKDALHLASAARAGCDWFLTTDRGIFKRVREVGTMRVGNPIDFIMEECNGN